MQRRALLALIGGSAASIGAPAPRAGAQPAAAARPGGTFAVPWPLARFHAGTAGSIDLADALGAGREPVMRWRLRANIADAGQAAAPFVSAASQFPEYTLEGSVLRFDGSARPALAPGASATQLQVEATTAAGFDDDASALRVSDVATILVDAPPARIRHGLDSWDDFDALARAVQGTAPAGSAPNGRTELIGRVFEITPGMFSEGGAGAADHAPSPAPVAAIQFPCTVAAMDVKRRPVLRSVTAERDVIQVHATRLPPIDGDVVLRDLVIRDNRHWTNTGEAGVRIKDRFAGRSVVIERCEFIRCQNAIAGGTLGQTLRVVDCRIVDCGVGEQAHALYVSPQRLEFFGNVVMQSPGNRLARAHLLKCRALHARILGNRFALNDCPGSYLIDLSNGGDVEIGGNRLAYGSASDNASATLVAYAPEGASGDAAGAPGRFAAGRRFALAARNNTLVSAFPGRSIGFVLHRHVAPNAAGEPVDTTPDPLTIADNVFAWDEGVLVLQSDRSGARPMDIDRSADFPANTRLARAPAANTLGPYAARRFTGHTDLGTGSREHTFTTRGAG